MFTVLDGGDVFDPAPLGAVSLLIAGSRIAKIGTVDRRAVESLGVECEFIDASGRIVAPGFIDPHGHLLGGSGEGGLEQQTPRMFVHEIARAGVTSVVGTLGVDTTMLTIAGLLGRVKGLNEMGISARLWTGGYNVPPTTVLGSIREDMMFIDEVVGAGEIAISDERGLNQSSQELAKLVRDTHVGGLLSGKAGLTHFHVGEENTRLAPLREIIEQFQVKCEWLYPTHIQRNEKLLREAIDLANSGAQVDMDVVAEDLAEWLPRYIDAGGPLERLTISSDMDSATPDVYQKQFRELITCHGFSLDLVLPLFTSNPATILKLQHKGALRVGHDADVVIMTKDTLEVETVIARGKVVVRDGEPLIRETWLAKSKRDFAMRGDKAPKD